MRRLRFLLALCGLASAFALAGGASAHSRGAHHRAGNSLIKPAVSEWQFVSSDATPPSQVACNAVGRRCFTPASMANSYDYAGLHQAGNEARARRSPSSTPTGRRRSGRTWPPSTPPSGCPSLAG